MYQPLFSQLQNNPNITVITANQRLSSHLLKQYARLMRANTTWPKPKIVSMHNWLEDCYLQGLDSGHMTKRLLNPLQQYALWHKIISNNTNELALLRTEATIYAVQQAWSSLQQWALPLDSATLCQSMDTKMFYQWATQFHQDCEDMQVIDRDRLIHCICQSMATQKVTVDGPIIFVGFLEFTPSQQQLLNTLEQNQCPYQILSHPQQSATTIKKTVCHDEHTEIQQMAYYALSTAQQFPHKTIACIIPNLNDIRPKLVNQCETLFPPDIAYNISGGESLAHHSMIQHALLLFKLCFNQVDFIDISELIRSPYLTFAEQEGDERVLFEVALRQTHQIRLSLPALTRHCQRYHHSKHACQHLLAILEKLCGYRKTISAKNHPSAWINIFIDILHRSGWPGDKPLNSEQYQRHQTWQNCLHEFASLDWVLSPLDFNHVFPQLKHHVQQSLFQKQDVEANVYFLGLLEAVGSSFDCIWMSHCNDQNWPAPAKPNAFLPIELQRQYGMPHANAQRELRFSQTIMQCLQNSCETLTFSYAKQQGEQIILASPLINPFAESTYPMPVTQQLTPPVQQQIITDHHGPAVNKKSTVIGGSQLFKQQAACPFQAFANLRLHTKPLETPQTILTAAQRGDITHQILQQLWQKLQDQQTLLNMSGDDLQTLIAEKVFNVLERFKCHYPQLLKPQFFQLEQQRLCQLIEQWLNYEKQRSYFKVVATEASQRVDVAGLQVNLTVDRIDQATDDQAVIIDYKTAEVKTSDWFNDRLNEPQLPLYAITHPSHLQGIAFAQVRCDKMQFKGITTEGNQLLDCSSVDANTWQQQLADWQQQLTGLANEYADGFAAVDPKSALSCQYCQLHILCRVQEEYEVDDVSE